MKWKPQYATGDSGIDAQHKTLFETTDQFRQTLEVGQGAATYDLFLEFLTAYAEAHFALEEECMRVRKCPAAKQNKHEHARFMRQIEQENARFAAEGFTHESANAMLDMIDRWLDSHICRIDIKLRDTITT